ncbi:protealysin inhibitor emfourin [Salinibacterium sp. UTAS2018]|uniref:protealysin inhibitor emfourin n=1 Tax=Salinibacterium sp. UTAS2018 TaxID=2508880 RepID=UPI001AEF9C8B|nr:protealysin inhibitor emfourin [Salinibacterium sp. UTAS2018]
MKVQVWRSGGLLGRRVEWAVVVDEQPDPDQWYLLIYEIPWNEHPAENTMPDRYTYEIHCEPHEAVIPEQQLVGPWRELVDRVREADPNPQRPRPESQPAPKLEPESAPTPESDQESRTPPESPRDPQPQPEAEIECD